MVLEHRNLRQMHEVAVVAARLAGQRAMEEIKYIKASIKKGNELVTQADSRCQQIIIDRIKENYPDHGFIAEEGGQDSLFKQSPRGGQDVWWVIDPIDGTNNFAHKLLCFSVSIAVMHAGQPIVGVIFNPATESMFTAVKDGDAQLNGTRITASDEKLTDFARFGIEGYFAQGTPKWAPEIFEKTRFRSFGSCALQLAYIAAGGLSGGITLYPKLWDIAAGAFIAQRAGAIVTDCQGNKIFPVDLANYNGEQTATLAAGKTIHAQMLKLMQS